MKPFNKANIEEMVATWGGLRVEPLPQLNLGTYNNPNLPPMRSMLKGSKPFPYPVLFDVWRRNLSLFSGVCCFP